MWSLKIINYIVNKSTILLLIKFVDARGRRSWRCVLDTILCDKVCQWLATGRWFSHVSSTNKTDRHDITEISLKVAPNTMIPMLDIGTGFQSGRRFSIYCFLCMVLWTIVLSFFLRYTYSECPLLYIKHFSVNWH